MRRLISIAILHLASQGTTQVFESGEVQLLVRKGADHIYNANTDSSYYYIGKIGKLIPNHPVVPLMKAMTTLWINIPTISPQLFVSMERQLDSVVLLATAKDSSLEDPEMMFFAMSAYGLLAEYYADQGYTMKAAGVANRAYGLLRRGFDLADDYPEYLFTTGLYNYFREKYPEKHPIYKPLLWFFKSGDINLGLAQLERATKESFLTRVEAHMYLSYIYLRFENDPKKAQKHLSVLCNRYPDNFYVKAKYLESLANPVDFKRVPLTMVYSLVAHKSPYYRLAGYVFLGYYQEKVMGDMDRAELAYRTGLGYDDRLPDHGEFFKSFGYLGLGRILLDQNKSEEAASILNLALEYVETEQIEAEARELLSQI